MTNRTLFRTSAAGLVSGVLLFTLGDLLRRLVEPSGNATARAVTHAVGSHGTGWLFAVLLSLAAAPLLVAGAFGLLLTARGRGGRTTTVGAVLLVLGALASVGHAVAFYTPYAVWDRADASPATITALDDASGGYPALVVLIVLFIVGMMLGSLLVLVGLRRARRVPVWAPVAGLVFVVCGSSGGVLPGVLGVVAGLVAFVPAARALSSGPGAASDAGHDGAEQLAHA
jgi:hypothetical protein